MLAPVFVLYSISLQSMKPFDQRLVAELHQNGFLSIRDLRRNDYSLEESSLILWTHCNSNLGHWDLLLSTVTEDNNVLQVQLDRLSRIRAQTNEPINEIRDICRSCPNLKQCRIVSIFSLEFSWEEVMAKLGPFVRKTKSYQRKRPAINILQRTENISSTMKQEPCKTVPSKGIKQALPPKNKEVLSKKSATLKQPPAVLTNYSAMRSTVEEKTEPSQVKKKMLIDSDEEIYNPQTFQKMMEIECPKEEDASGKKTCPKAASISDDDDDDDDDVNLFAKMSQQASKIKETQVKAGSQGSLVQSDGMKGELKGQLKESKASSGKPIAKGLLGWLSKT